MEIQLYQYEPGERFYLSETREEMEMETATEYSGECGEMEPPILPILEEDPLSLEPTIGSISDTCYWGKSESKLSWNSNQPIKQMPEERSRGKPQLPSPSTSLNSSETNGFSAARLISKRYFNVQAVDPQTTNITSRSVKNKMKSFSTSTRPTNPFLVMPKGQIRFAVSLQQEKLTPSLLAKLVMPSPDFTINKYVLSDDEEVFTISETILNDSKTEIIRKSITIRSNWSMNFSIFSHDVNKFNRSNVANSISALQEAINSFSAQLICVGVQPKVGFGSMPMPIQQSLIMKYCDNHFRSTCCPLVISSGTERRGQKISRVANTGQQNTSIRCAKCEEINECLNLIDTSKSLPLRNKNLFCQN